MVELNCPFCGAREVERLRMEEKLVVVFPCMFSPVLDGVASEGDLPGLVAAYAKEGTGYFQKQCDRLHYFVTKGAGAVLPAAAPQRDEVGPTTDGTCPSPNGEKDPGGRSTPPPTSASSTRRRAPHRTRRT